MNLLDAVEIGCIFLHFMIPCLVLASPRAFADLDVDYDVLVLNIRDTK